MARDPSMYFFGFLTSVLIQLLFSKPLTTFLTGIRGARQKITGKKRCTWKSSPQLPGQESDMLPIELAGRADKNTRRIQIQNLFQGTN